MPQLDLFAPKTEKKADTDQLMQKPAKQKKEDTLIDSGKSVVEIAEETLMNRKVVSEEVDQEKVEPEITNGVVFSNEHIGVKVKEKAPKAIVEVKEPAQKKASLKVKRAPQKRGRKSLKEVNLDADLIEIPEDEELFKKQYYPISLVAQWFRVNTSLLRFWENEFDILKPKKNRKGDRLFRPEDVKNIQLIYNLLRQRKYSIEGAKDFLNGNKEKADIQMQVTHTLQKFKSFLLELKANLQS